MYKRQRWGIPAGDGAEFYVFTDWAYRSEVNFFLYESKEFTGKSSLEGGLRLGYNWNHGDYGVAAVSYTHLDVYKRQAPIPACLR